MATIVKFCAEENLKTDQFPKTEKVDDSLSEMKVNASVKNSYRMYREGKTLQQIAQEREGLLHRYDSSEYLLGEGN